MKATPDGLMGGRPVDAGRCAVHIDGGDAAVCGATAVDAVDAAAAAGSAETSYQIYAD